MEIETGPEGVLTVEGTEVGLPWGIEAAVATDGRVLVLLDPATPGVADPVLRIDNELRNLLAVGRSGEIQWVVEAPADAERDADRLESILEESADDLVVRASDGGFHRIDTATGQLLESWSDDEYAIGDQVIEFADPVRSIFHYRDSGTTVVHTDGDDSTLRGFDREGRTLWRRPADEPYQWAVRDVRGWNKTFRSAHAVPDDEVGGIALYAWDVPVRGTNQSYRVDERTGLVVEAIRAPPHEAREIVDWEAVDEPRLYPWGTDCALLDADGTERWRVSLETAIRDAERVDEPVTHEDGERDAGPEASDDAPPFVVLRTREGVFAAVDADGEFRWKRDLGVQRELDRTPDGLVVRSAETGAILATLDPATGATAPV